MSIEIDAIGSTSSPSSQDCQEYLAGDAGAATD
jgi:hypothetical protein